MTQRCTIICEAGVNHDGDLGKALKLCDAAKEVGANIVKFQTFDPHKSIKADSKDFALLAKLALPYPAFVTIANHCRDIGIEFLSTPDHMDDLKFLVEECGMRRVKIGSGSLLWAPLVDAAFDTRLPVLLSTGMATIKEVYGAVERQWQRRKPASGQIREQFDLTLLHCVSLYPCPPHLANVRRVVPLRDLWAADGAVPFPVGYSDHTVGIVAPCAAVALGATVIEKHFTLDCTDDGPDHKMSTDPFGFALMVNAIRATEEVLGDGRKDLSPEELAMIPRVRKDEDGFQPGI